MKKTKFFQVDAFASRPFKGNPAAVCLLNEEISAEQMQWIAAENNLAETAFVSPAEDGFNLRWFTPTVEIDLCGHATLATSHILWQENILSEEETARFHTRSGLLTASKKGEWVELDFPASVIKAAELPEGIRTGLDIHPVNVVFAKDRYLIELATPEEVASLVPDFSALKEYDALIVTSPGAISSPYDFVSRTFAPSHGIDEDSVTGSSHCALVPYYSAKLGKKQFFAYQASARGGELKLELAGDRVLIAGQAVTVISGTFTF